MKLIKPIFEIMNYQNEIFEDHWQSRSEAYDLLNREDVQDILKYTNNYINTFTGNKKVEKILYFYKEHVELLLKYDHSKFNEYPGTYMYLYNELLLGAKRYSNIKNELKELGCNIEEVGSST